MCDRSFLRLRQELKPFNVNPREVYRWVQVTKEGIPSVRACQGKAPWVVRFGLTPCLRARITDYSMFAYATIPDVGERPFDQGHQLVDSSPKSPQALIHVWLPDWLHSQVPLDSGR